MSDKTTDVAEPEVLLDHEPKDSEWSRMTPEAREKDVEKAVATVQERHPDIEIQPKQTKQPVIDDDVPVDDDAAEPEKVSEGEEVGESDWLDDETRDFAGSYGLDEDFVKSLQSKEVLDNVLKAIDKKAFEAAKTGEPPAESKLIVQQTEKPVVPTSQDDRFADPAKYKLGDQFDEEAAAPINTFMENVIAELKELRSFRNSFQQNQAQQAADNLRRQATDALHSLGNTELFGKPGEIQTKEQIANVEKAIDAHFTHARGLIATGRQAAPTPAFLKAAVHLAFGDQLSKQQMKQLTEKLRKQSARRTGGTASKPMPQAIPENETQKQRAARIAADPDVQRVWNQLTSDRTG